MRNLLTIVRVRAWSKFLNRKENGGGSPSVTASGAWKLIYFEFDLGGDRRCTEFLAEAQLIVWQAQIPNPMEAQIEDEEYFEEYNEKFQTIFDAIRHAELVKDK